MFLYQKTSWNKISSEKKQVSKNFLGKRIYKPNKSKFTPNKDYIIYFVKAFYWDFFCYKRAS